MSHRLYIDSLQQGYLSAIQKGLEWINLKQRVKPGDHVFIKPNLTFPSFRKGVMTNPECLEQLVIALKDYSVNITIGEADSGGYNRFKMDEVFEKTGVDALGKRYGVTVVNLSHVPSRVLSLGSNRHPLEIQLPAMLFDEVDLFITVPVPKVHLNTIVSLSIKNQWGLIQETDSRLKLHPNFKKIIYGVNKALPPSLSMIDGKYGLTRSGPLRGDVVDLNWLLLCDNIYIADFVCCSLMQVDYRRVPHLRYILQQEGIKDLEGVEFNQDYRQFIATEPFYLKREWTDYPGVMTFNSRFLAYIGYESPLAKPLHWLLYKFREPFY